MTNCKICGRELKTKCDWCCNNCLNDYPSDSDDIAEWAASRAREFERDGINKLIEELKDIAVSLSQDTGEDTDSGQYYAYLISSIIKEYKKE